MAASTVFTFFMGLFIYWLVFDLALNTKRELPWYYVGKGKKAAFTDKLIYKFPKMAVYVKILLVSICGFLHLTYKTYFLKTLLILNTWM
jgi:hypothetical protein